MEKQQLKKSPIIAAMVDNLTKVIDDDIIKNILAEERMENSIPNIIEGIIEDNISEQKIKEAVLMSLTKCKSDDLQDWIGDEDDEYGFVDEEYNY